MAFKITPAVRNKIPGLFMFWGPSASGKTYSALRFARGLVGDAGRICVIDTENGRARFYAKTATKPGIGGDWDHLDLPPPFTPQRYIEAIRQAEQDGYDVIVIDSMSHVWAGEGGVLDEAEKIQASGLAKWAKPKMGLKRMINAALRTKCHVIFCLRAKSGVKSVGRGRDMEIMATGLTPIMEKGLIYEMLISVLFGPDHKPMFKSIDDTYFIDPHIPGVKAPAGIIELIKPGEFITEATGDSVRQWLDGGDIDLVGDARRAAERGTVTLKAFWDKIGKTDKVALQQFMAENKAIAALADAEIAKEKDPKTWEEQETAEPDGEVASVDDNAISSSFDDGSDRAASRGGLCQECD
jgi:hypothetical protein